MVFKISLLNCLKDELAIFKVSSSDRSDPIFQGIIFFRDVPAILKLSPFDRWQLIIWGVIFIERWARDFQAVIFWPIRPHFLRCYLLSQMSSRFLRCHLSTDENSFSEVLSFVKDVLAVLKLSSFDQSDLYFWGTCNLLEKMSLYFTGCHLQWPIRPHC